MKIKSIVIVLALLGLSIQVSADTLNCPSLTTKSDGTKVCIYEPSKAVDYAVKNYKESAQDDGNFAVYDNNCTNFVSQSVLAGFAETKYRSTLYSKREQYLADENDTYSWFYRSKWDTGVNWKQAHSLYLYAKYTDENDSGSNYNDNGPKFDFVTRDSDIAYLDPNDVIEGDIIFADFNSPDGIIDHVFIVTGKEWYQSFYNKIRVTSNSSYYTDKGLGEINEAYGQDIHFYVYRPVAYVEK